ncbi:MAG: DUF4058 family protein [Leptolyngbyaceae cyanobacterium bins.349]|nr:DUF4058 family protein [Leptolyngbyaceae cyanobacterium bins.349]
MPSPFPGMNPYLEAPTLWAGVHHWLITEIARSLLPQLRPRYFVAVEERVYEANGDWSALVGIPDNVVIQSGQPESASGASKVAVALAPTQPMTVTLPMPETIREGYLEVREVGTEAVITVIEVLSPTNKRSGEGRSQYEAKRQKVFGSSTHLVEIDLLHQWEPMPVLNLSIQSQYRILVSRSDRRPQADLYAFNLPDPIPAFKLPLQAGDIEPVVDLQALLHNLYDQGGYDLRLNYRQNPQVTLSASDVTWVENWLHQQGLRP